MLTALKPQTFGRPQLFPRYSHSHTCVSNKPVTRARSANSSGGFFDRNIEREFLLELFQSRPSKILVLMGPINCGKTALLKHVLSALEEKGAAVSYIDTRANDMTTPSGMARVLSDVPRNWFQKDPKLADFAGSIGGGVKVQLPANVTEDTLQAVPAILKKLSPDQGPLDATISMHQAFLQNRSQDGLWPVIVIDEANSLSSWDPAHKSARTALLQFLVKVSKQDRNAHVVLATSDFTFFDWLVGEVREGYIGVDFIGDFPRDDAKVKAFMEHLLERRRSRGGLLLTADTTLTEGAWDEVYKACGGTAGTLVICESNYKGNRQAAIKDTTRSCAIRIYSAMSPSPSAGWTREQLLAIMRMLCASKHGAVPRHELEARLGPGGPRAVRALIKAHLLSLRPAPSNLARDIPIEAWDEAKNAALVTAASAAHLSAMRTALELRAKVPTAPAVGNEWAGVQVSFPVAGQAETKSEDVYKWLESTEEMLAKLEGQLANVDRQIEILRQEKSEHWLEELSYLSKEKEQLNEMKLQVMKQQLSEMKLLVMKKLVA